MPFVDVNMICGHTEHVFLADTRVRVLRRHTEDYENNFVCIRCMMADFKNINQSMLLYRETHMWLPSMVGSVKQVEWAKNLRMLTIGQVLNHAQYSDQQKEIALRIIKHHQWSGWWIEHKNKNDFRFFLSEARDLVKVVKQYLSPIDLS